MHSRFSRFHIAAGKRSRNIQYHILFPSVESAQETMSRFSPADEYIQIIFIEHNLKHSQTLPIRQGMKRLRELSNSFPRLLRQISQIAGNQRRTGKRSQQIFGGGIILKDKKPAEDPFRREFAEPAVKLFPYFRNILQFPVLAGKIRTNRDAATAITRFPAS